MGESLRYVFEAMNIFGKNLNKNIKKDLKQMTKTIQYDGTKWKLVPRIPNQMQLLTLGLLSASGSTDKQTFIDAYKAMLSAAPTMECEDER